MLTDLSYLQSMSNNDMNFITEMIDIFKVQIEEYSTELPLLLKAEDYESIAKVAHKAKSSVAVMGMKNDAELLNNLEIKSRAGIETETFSELINTFITHSAEAISELEEQLKKA